MTDRDYQHSRILDVHRWSEHQEANLFVDEVYDTFLNRHVPLDQLIILQKACQETDDEMR